MDKKNICLVSSQYLPHIGGVENFVFNLSRELAVSGHKVTIVTSLAEGLAEYEQDGNIEIFRLPSYQLMNGRFPVLKPFGWRKKFESEFVKRRFDLVLVNMRFFFISLYAVKLAKRLGIRCIMLDHGSTHLNTGGKLTSMLGEWFEHWITWREKKYCKEFAGVSKESIRWIEHFKIKSDMVISNAVDVDRFIGYIENPTRDFRREYGIPDGHVLISFVGRMTVEKGVRELVNVFNRLAELRDDVWLLMAGDGYLKDELEPIKHKRTVFLGAIPSSEVACLLNESDIFCLPSYSEGFPTCVLEAMLCNTFVITTYKGDAKEIITSKEYGIILPDNSEQPLYEALKGVIDEKEYREAAARLCYNIVTNTYTWRHTSQRLLEIIGDNNDGN
ncbi:MAG: glycosyltransferase family 4 protein [Clostridia bacterium]|nr:glycosyltransferase family 4 protein [Clostridia bacterium]MBQ8289933.1 glycosyltransferase family 4 protein [Clostridia bacterium]